MNFEWPLRIYYEDTDSGGVVYYANYLKFMERGRTEYLRHLGFEQDQLIEQQNILFAVSSIQVDYKYPARFNDELLVVSKLVDIQKVRMTFNQHIIKPADNNRLLCQGEIQIVCLLADQFRPCPIPNAILEAVGDI